MMDKLTFMTVSQIPDADIKYAVITARYRNQWILCRHKDRCTWEIPGGHREPGETALEAAHRELREETGAKDYDLNIVGAYRLTHGGLLCFAEIHTLGEIPAGSEIAQIELFEILPEDLTYGDVHRSLHKRVQNWLNLQSGAGELWDIYDENRQFTGRQHRRGDFLSPGDYHLSVHVWMRNSQGKFLMTKRSPNKGFPNMWETTGGSAVSGDDSLTAALREVYEETGLTLDPAKGKLFTTVRNHDTFSDVWVFQQDFDLADVVLLEGETCDAKYADREEILHMRTQGKLVHYEYLDDLLRVTY